MNETTKAQSCVTVAKIKHLKVISQRWHHAAGGREARAESPSLVLLDQCIDKSPLLWEQLARIASVIYSAAASGEIAEAAQRDGQGTI